MKRENILFEAHHQLNLPDGLVVGFTGHIYPGRGAGDRFGGRAFDSRGVERGSVVLVEAGNFGKRKLSRCWQVSRSDCCYVFRRARMCLS